jgi:hypothetical protein
MPARVLLTAVVAVTCFAAAPAGPPRPEEPGESVISEPPGPTGQLPTNAEFAALLRADPVRAFEAVLRRCKAEIHGLTCVMQKQERLAGQLGPVEVVDVAFRDDPFSVYMAWRGSVGLGKPVKSLYVQGENGGLTKVKTRFLTLNFPPDGKESRDAARYSIEDFGFYHTTLRTHRAWKAARDAGQFHYEFLETRPVPECGGRTCHVIRRTCDPPEVDTFSLAEKGTIAPAAHPKEAFVSVVLMFDAETWLQVGTEQKDATGDLVGAYYFREIKLNPKFEREQFTPAALTK